MRVSLVDRHGSNEYESEDSRRLAQSLLITLVSSYGGSDQLDCTVCSHLTTLTNFGRGIGTTWQFPIAFSSN